MSPPDGRAVRFLSRWSQIEQKTLSPASSLDESLTLGRCAVDLARLVIADVDITLRKLPGAARNAMD